MRPLVIYHANCADGFAAAFAAWLKLGDDAEYVPMQYGKDDVFKIPPWTARDVYILDFSLPRDYMDKIFSEAKRVVWLDHHKTALRECENQKGNVGISFGSKEAAEWRRKYETTRYLS